MQSDHNLPALPAVSDDGRFHYDGATWVPFPTVVSSEGPTVSDRILRVICILLLPVLAIATLIAVVAAVVAPSRADLAGFVVALVLVATLSFCGWRAHRS